MAQALGKSGTDWNPQVLLGGVLDKTPTDISFLTHAENLLACKS